MVRDSQALEPAFAKKKNIHELVEAAVETGRSNMEELDIDDLVQ